MKRVFIPFRATYLRNKFANSFEATMRSYQSGKLTAAEANQQLEVDRNLQNAAIGRAMAKGHITPKSWDGLLRTKIQISPGEPLA